MQPILLTPGPLTTSERTRSAMLSDWGSWDGEFNRLTASVCGDLLAIAGGEGTHACVPLQGSGTFAVEAALGTFVPRTVRFWFRAMAPMRTESFGSLRFWGVKSASSSTAKMSRLM